MHEDLFAQVVENQPFPLDPFQLEAIQNLADGKSVLVSAPTGSGKTVVAEFAIHLALGTNTRCIYTTPLKALSNQKFRDLRKQLGDKVGLVTGDVVINPEAPALIMTTEILRNILHIDPSRVEDVSQVVLDEAHYLGSDGRGTVWEETIVFLGKQTTITALSATIANSQELADWVSGIHKEMKVIYHEERPVPLEAYVAAPKVIPLFTKKGGLRIKQFIRDGHLQIPEPPEYVKELDELGMLPAISFVFSRMGCEAQALSVVRANLKLTNKQEKRQIEEAVAQAIEQTPGMLNSAGTKRWLDILPEGVAPHHAGLLPPLKFLIETLFQRGLIKIVFATETLAAGINMPAKTVVLSSLSKRTDEGNRNLTVGEFHQMTGRAGRRGMDPVGFVVVLASNRYAPDEVAMLVKGKVEPLRSRFTLNYNMVSNLVHNYELAAARRIVEQCFSQFQNDHAVQDLTEDRKRSADRLEGLTPTCPTTGETLRIKETESYRQLKSQHDSLRKRLAGLEAARQYLPFRQANHLMDQAEPGGWLLVHPPGFGVPQIAILLTKQTIKSGEVRYGVLLENKTIVQLGAKHLIALLPGHHAEGIPGALIHRAERLNFLQSMSLPDMPIIWKEWVAKSGLDLEELKLPVEESSEVAKCRVKFEKIQEQVEQHPCTRCRIRRNCLSIAKEYQLLSQSVRRFDQEIEMIRSNNWRQFLALQAVLNQAGYMRERELLARGVAISHLRTTNEMIAAEAIASGLLEHLS
ncbi:MAG: DEAD/DEAH box helicase, partial [Bacteroidota bacterium]